MEDCDIIELYWQRDQSAIAETSEKYGGFLWSIAWNVLRSHGDAEECVNDTYLRTWNAIPPARPSAFRAWLGRITRNLSLDRWKQSRAEKRGGNGMEVLLGELDQCIPAPHGTEQALEDREIAGLISAFLRTLPQEPRLMFLRRYWYGQEVQALARAWGVSPNQMAKRLQRLRKDTFHFRGKAS